MATRAKAEKKGTKEEVFEVSGERLLSKFKKILREGNARRVTIKNQDGKEIVVFPLIVGVVGALMAPVLAAVGAIAALIGKCTITVERK